MDASDDNSEVFRRAKRAIIDKGYWKPEGNSFVTDFNFDELGNRTAPAIKILFEEMGIKFSVHSSHVGMGATIKFSLLSEELFKARAKLNEMEL